MKANTLFFQSDQVDEADALCGSWIKKTSEIKLYYTKWVEIFERFSYDMVHFTQKGRLCRGDQ